MTSSVTVGARASKIGLALLGLVAAACRLPDDVIATTQSGVSDGGSSSGGAGAAGSAGASVEMCTGFIPAISLPVSAGARQEMCAGFLATRAFSHAVCSCGDLDVLAVLASDAWDSTSEDTSPDRRGAAVGVNGDYDGGEYVRIGGSFTVAGNAPLASRGGIDVAGDLRLAAATTAAGPIFVARDAWLLQSVSSLSIATVGRDLRLGPNGTLDALGVVVAGGATSHEAFEITPPCACAEADLIDVGGVVADGMGHNDNARIGLAPGALDVATSSAQLMLPCGRFALRAIHADAAATVRVSGRVLLFVDGDAELGRSFSLQLEPGAELDWFIRGNLSVSGESLIGDQARPGAVRMYVLGGNDIALPGTARFSANVYAPRARLSIGALGDVYGAVFGATVTSLGPLLSHYDRAVLRADERCSLQPTRCSGCEQCGNGQACVDSVCTACASDRDCCFPLACERGTCQALPAD